MSLLKKLAFASAASAMIGVIAKDTKRAKGATKRSPVSSAAKSAAKPAKKPRKAGKRTSRK